MFNIKVTFGYYNIYANNSIGRQDDYGKGF